MHSVHLSGLWLLARKFISLRVGELLRDLRIVGWVEPQRNPTNSDLWMSVRSLSVPEAYRICGIRECDSRSAIAQASHVSCRRHIASFIEVD